MTSPRWDQVELLLLVSRESLQRNVSGRITNVQDYKEGDTTGWSTEEETSRATTNFTLTGTTKSPRRVLDCLESNSHVCFVRTVWTRTDKHHSSDRLITVESCQSFSQHVKLLRICDLNFGSISVVLNIFFLILF